MNYYGFRFALTGGLITAKKTNPFLSSEQMKEVVEKAGFVLEESTQGYVGIVIRYVFRKPISK